MSRSWPPEGRDSEQHEEETEETQPLTPVPVREATIAAGPRARQARTPYPIDGEASPGGELLRGARVDRYVVLKSVGEGGMGVVYAAYDPELDRKVALKLLRLETSDVENGRARLLREAQAMARVSHPNVCSVYDVGTFGDQVFITMEFISGSTLHQWMKQEHSWRDILRVFLQAGRGLEAAHAVGLVHRDFKPANVLLGKGERAYVTDFGLARLVSSPEEDEPSVALAPPPGSVSGSMPGAAASVTQAGVVVGTPNYMPPEQYLGQMPDARSDQFSFCAALFWALYGKRPFEPSKVAQAAEKLGDHTTAPRSLTSRVRGDSELQGVIHEPPSNTKVPAWVRRAVLKGLSLHAEDRFGSMTELLTALSQEPRRAARRQGLLVTAGLVLAGSIAAGVQIHQQSQVCAGSDQLMAQVWNPDVRRKVEAAFTATGRAFAPEVAHSVSRVLDTYAGEWVRQHTEACEATRVRGVQTEELLSLQVVCLERHRQDFQALAHLLTEADRKLMERSVDAVNGLPSPRECQDIVSLSNQVGMPTDPALRGRIDQLGKELSEAKALGRAGRYKDALSRAKELEPRVVATGYLPLQAELRASLGWYQQLTGDADAGAAHVEQALNDAEAGRADRLKVEALNRLVFIRGIQGRQEQAEQWARLSGSVLSRLGGDTLLASELEGNLGNVALRQGNYAEARRHFEKTRELQQQVLAPEDPRRTKTTYNLGVAALMLHERERALELLTEALGRMEATLGEGHPQVADCHSMLAWTNRELGRMEPSLEHARAAVAIQRASFGEEHPAVADALDAVGMSLLAMKRHDEARKTFETALAMKEKALGPDSPDLSFSYDGIGQALLAADRAEEAIAPLEKALSFEDVEPEPLAESGFALARALWQAGKEPLQAHAVAAKARERFAQIGEKERVAEVDAWLQSHPVPEEKPKRSRSKAAAQMRKKKGPGRLARP
ncbi:serine/threonine protein kinase [Archangium violaceum]|uniref:serine/threonine-protein kinase n=1 Tax=Archangium violaceum TaxID=83451 RepID=UPI00193AF590|nr:serine/threonine-protein kinase [Archangium violaceum]QRK08122.1 serine/threonine protein kinase [Archangium violaceum]